MARSTTTLPVEVELALQVMPCQAMRRIYDSAAAPHPCAHFAEWGAFHSFDYDQEGPPPQPGISHPSVYAGKRPLAPEILSGCRKAPILAVGINPNLPGWTPSSRNAIHPYFDDYLQYAHYFRWRATNKLRIPRERYRTLLGEGSDGPFDNRPLVAAGQPIDVEHAPVTMYEGYQSLLDGLAERLGWAGHSLAVGEDIAYANMVACGSARWTTRPVDGMPVMGEAGARGIVQECFHDRKYFLKQMVQSLPAVVMVFSQTTANAFINAMQGRFTKGDPQPQEPLNSLIQREIRLRFGQAADGQLLDARVVFSPHVSARPEDFEAQREVLVGHLAAEVEAGRLELNPATGHLRRKRGGCLFCENSLYSIGRCDYRDELAPLAGAGIEPLSDTAAPPGEAEREEHIRLLDEFTAPRPDPSPEGQNAFLDDAAPSAPRLVLLGEVATMAGEVIADGAVYTQRGDIVAVQKAGDPPPAGFEDARRVNTEGVIYPGLADLHNHLVYNALSLWWPRAARVNRAQWLRDAEYKRLVSLPMEVIAKRQDLLKALVRYVEVKLMLGGVTSGQGMVSKYRGGGHFRGLVRNFEQSDDPNLASIRHKITDLQDRDIENFRNILDSGARYFFHLAEGTNEQARAQYGLLQANRLLADNLVGVHSLGLQSVDLDGLAAVKGAVVWSPFSNSILYGRTLRPDELLSSGARFGLGSDWTPSGSRNILMEMKVAKLTAEAVAAPLSAERLARSVTVDAMDIAGWGERLGQVAPGLYADLVVMDRQTDDPYENLLRSTERNVRLVIIAGHARHGDRELMLAVGISPDGLEAISVGGRDKALNLEHPSSPLNHISFADAKAALERAMADLPAARDAAVFEPFDDGDFIEVELELQAPEPEFGEIDALADVELPQSIPLDQPTVIDDAAYWDVLERIGHLPAFLKGPDGLRRYYG